MCGCNQPVGSEFQISHRSSTQLYQCGSSLKCSDSDPICALQVQGKGSGKVIASGHRDRVFLFYSDHGAPGVLGMPSGRTSGHLLVPLLQCHPLSWGSKSLGSLGNLGAHAVTNISCRKYAVRGRLAQGHQGKEARRRL